MLRFYLQGTLCFICCVVGYSKDRVTTRIHVPRAKHSHWKLQCLCCWSVVALHVCGWKGTEGSTVLKLELLCGYISLENSVTKQRKRTKWHQQWLNWAITIPLVKQGRKKQCHIFFFWRRVGNKGFCCLFQKKTHCVLLGNQCLIEFVYTVIIQD